ncbi:SDR family NAD(P)-dependent oxidoreductase [Seohaeicola zhoushanensis]|uniref:Short-chain dehydrogenase n=1 Tax=Seohaeicola zhoushanensis TaxID=1569283 RepID=A0A8J3H2U9_9RHOB|nr:SDR family NAD(P)-dependent oxidoreductase [Seohaeicola zhoushanensis]GHF69034.1 short-chain dehydrogenase [Seohaeicola zhoushanensis]
MKTAVISGGNGGLGRALARALQARGWHTVLLDRDIAGLETTSAQTPVQVDLTDPSALDAAIAKVVAARPSIDLVIYNAGISQIAAFEDTPDATHRRVFEINYFAAVAMARGFLQPLRQARGTHLAISSVAGFSPLYRRTAYAASKHALEGLFGSLRSEEAPHGVRVQIAAPSFVATNLGNAERTEDGIVRPGSAKDGVDYMTPDDAAAVILRGLDRGAPFIPVGRVARLAWWINRLSPSLFERLMVRNISGQS